MNAIVTGPDRNLRDALEAQGVEVTTLEGVVTREDLLEAGVTEADLIVITDVGEASAVPVARKDNPDIRVVIYDEETMPEFLRSQADLAVDPDLLDPETVAEELARNGDD
jgi:hypothetical protein